MWPIYLLFEMTLSLIYMYLFADASIHKNAVNDINIFFKITTANMIALPFVSVKIVYHNVSFYH